MHMNEKLLDELTAIICSEVKPLRIILFGSAARGELRPDSDLDLLVIIPDDISKMPFLWSVYPKLISLGTGIDIIVATETEFKESSNDRNLIYFHALKEGMEIYAA